MDSGDVDRFHSLTASSAGPLLLHIPADRADVDRNSFKRRASFSSTAFTDLRIATTAALAGGTVTLDPHAFSQSIRKANRVNPAAATEES